MDDKLNEMPLVELHLHLDGAVGIDKSFEILKRDNIDLGVPVNTKEDLKNLLLAGPNCKDLNEFLEKFDYTTKFLQTKENIKDITEDLVLRLAEDKVIYAEIRFAPQLHTENMSMEEAVKAAIDGCNEALKKCDTIKVKLILCMMRGGSYSDNLETINIASRFLNDGVGGIDLAGAEAIYKTDEYKELFDIAKSKNVPFTIHAGEADGPQSITDALDCGTSRIGHGVRIVEDENVLERAKEKGTLFEVCPTSNLSTKCFDKIENHSIKKMFDAGLNICISTDDPVITGVALRDEYRLVEKTFGFTIEDFVKMNRNSINASFMNENDKIMYNHILDSYLS
ncbi:MAG: adenosine deaminase [Clostridia bacterium]|nr:adenosine deaminase [Clostridia bacterium]